MASITDSVDVDVPVRVAYDQWTQFEDFPKFLSFVKSIRQIDDTHTHWVIEVAGSEHEFDADITEQHPDERVAWKATGGEKQAGVVTFHKLSDTTSRVTVQIDWEPEGFVEKVGAAVGVDDLMVGRDLKKFKEFIENRGTPTGEWRGDVQN